MGRKVRLMGSRFWDAVGGYLPEVCAIQQEAPSQDSFGEEEENWVDVEGMEEVACRVSPSGGTERKSPQAIWSVATHVITLAGAYPEITTKMRAYVDGQAYDILLRSVDGGGEVTRLVCEVVR